MPTSSARETVRELLAGAVQELAREGFLAAGAGEIPVSIERTKRPEHGDYASNVALTLAKPAGKPPRAVAEAIVARLTGPSSGRGSPIAEANIAGPGFINLRLAPAFWQAKLGADPGRRRGLGPAPRPNRRRTILLEYLSANPTGPDARGARPARRRGRRAGPPAALRRVSGYDRVLRQRRRQPGAGAGAVDLGPLHGRRARRRSHRPRGAVPGERLQGRLHPRLRAGAVRPRRCPLGWSDPAGRHRAHQVVRDRKVAGHHPRDAGAAST